MKDDEVEIFKAKLKNRQPIKSFEAPIRTVGVNELKDESLEKLLRLMQTLPNYQKRVPSPDKHVAIDFRMSYDQVTKSKCKLFEKVLRDPEVFNFEYFEEPITEYVGSFLLRIWMNKQ